MNDDPSNSPSATPATPESSSPTATGNQNLIGVRIVRKKVLAVMGLILGAVVLLLFLIILQMGSNDFGGGTSEITRLREELEERKKSLGSGNSPVPSRGETPRGLANRLSTDSARLAGLVTRLQAMLNKVQSDLAKSQTTVRTLSNQLATETNNSADNATLKQQLDVARTRSNAAESQLQSLQQQFAGAPTAAQMEAVLKERDTLRSQLTRLREQTSRTGAANSVEQEPGTQPEGADK
ncbi:MAG: hypothetical protein HRU37_07885 [Roseibacillus sp.]|nr:hypothetical protein [Deltaproteobacteria bacterium]NRB27585.1 hypothetical protein [Roseibacillus sp.]